MTFAGIRSHFGSQFVYARIRRPKPLAGAEVVFGRSLLAGAENIRAGTRFRLYAFWDTVIRIIRG